jgi:glutamate--cysteine ligase
VALKQDGVEYIEVRTLDINPFETLGICKAQIDFMEVFLYYLLCKESSPETDKSRECSRENLMRVTVQGRKAGLRLRCPQNDEFDLSKACLRLFSDLKKVAEVLDSSRNSSDFSNAVESIKKRVHETDLLPSKKVMHELKEHSFLEFTEQLSIQHQKSLLDFEADPSLQHYFKKASQESVVKQKQIEDEELDYQTYLQNFLRMD